MTSTLRRVYHITAFSWYAFIVKSLAAKDGEELPPGIFVYGGPWKYLTFLNLLLQMTFFGLATVNDLQPGKKSESTLNRCKDLLFSVFAFPVGMFVVLLFWTIFAYDRELVYPATIDTFFPPWMNHAMTNRLRNSFYPGAVASITTLPQSNDEGMLVERVLNICTQHTFVLPVLLGEVLVQPHTYPQTKHALAALGVVGLSYLFWIVWVYLSVGIWVYPLLGHFSTNGLMGFFFFNMSVVTLLYVLGDKLNSHVWSKGRNRMTTKAK